jgi:hypothetical protein
MAAIAGTMAADATAQPGAAAATTDPFIYCAQVGTVDGPEGGVGPAPVPAALEPFLSAALGTPADARIPPGSAYWRCMNGFVYVCAVGANLVCDRKPDHAKRNPGADAYCRDRPDAAEVPAYAAGHNSAYEWHCTAGHASRGRLAGKLDRQGFRMDIWHKVFAP